MGTKNNPGRFDCYDAAEPDEPMFVLLARDPIAPYLVGLWAAVRNGEFEAAYEGFETLVHTGKSLYEGNPENSDKAAEAKQCALAMARWKDVREFGSQCRFCGCTERTACRTPSGPCFWHADNVCSAGACVAALAAEASQLGEAREGAQA